MKRSACLVLASILALGCQTVAPPLDGLEPLSLEDPRIDALISAQNERAGARTGLRAALRMALDSPDLQFRRPERIVVRRPAQIRIEILALFGQIGAVLVTDGVRYQRIDVKTGEFESGPVSDDLLWAMARIRLTPREAVSLLLGAPVPSSQLDLREAYALSNGGVAIDYRSDESTRPPRTRERFEFDASGKLRRLTHWDGAGRLTWKADFDDYRDVSGSPFAFEVSLRFPDVDARARLQFDSVAFDSELADELFVLTDPNPRSDARTSPVIVR